MKNIIKALICLMFVFQNYNLNAQKSFAGIYIGKESNRKLDINEDGSFVLLNRDSYGDLMPLWQLDTLCNGSWKLKDGFLILNTPKNIDNNVMQIIVKEDYLPDKDTLFMKVLSPYENNLKSSNKKRVFSYLFLFDDLSYTIENEIKSESNTLSIPLNQKTKINGFMFWIIPDSYLYPDKLAFNYLQTEYYKLNSSKSNSLTITIPEFTLEYIGYERYRDEYVKVINSKKIKLRGEVFEKE